MSNQSLSQFFRKQIPVWQDLKILIPYSDGGSLYPLLKTNPALELIYLGDKSQGMEKQLPVSQEGKSRIHFIKDDIRSIRGMVDCDMVFCDLSRPDNKMNGLREELCLCRMLLKPGGKLIIRSLNNKKGSFWEIVTLKKGPMIKMLSGAGFCDIRTHKLHNGQVVCSGQRPSQGF
jgi:hypothetical protein